METLCHRFTAKCTTDVAFRADGFAQLMRILAIVVPPNITALFLTCYQGLIDLVIEFV